MITQGKGNQEETIQVSPQTVKKELLKFRDELFSEVTFIRSSSKRKSYALSDGYFIYSEQLDGYYHFPNHQFLNFAPETCAVFTIDSVTYKGFISYCSHEYIEVCVQNYSKPIDSLSMIVDTSKLTENLARQVESLDLNNKLLRLLVGAAQIHLERDGQPDRGFADAAEKVRNGSITMIWGPPGTGKTYTLANLALEQMLAGKKVLIISQSNISVDGAVLKIIDIAKEKGYLERIIGKVFRYGMAREPNLYSNENFCARLYAANQCPEIKAVLQKTDNIFKTELNVNITDGEIKELIVSSINILCSIKAVPTEKKNQLREMKTITENCGEENKWYKKTAQFIRAICHSILVKREEEFISKANIIATTATKATLMDKIRSISWDIIFFDEVSMAYVPQVMVAATMAKKLVLLGDFRQLAPIAQFSPKSILRSDIFTYLHANDPFGNVRNHPWMTMLNEQRRMHPNIASYISESLYNGMLVSAPGMRAKVSKATNAQPFPGKELTLVDYSELQTLCHTTSTGSRFNPLSAVIAMKLALCVIQTKGLSVGIITPYQAQAKLLSAMLKDASERIRGDKPDILCSTVHQFQGFEKDVIIFDTVESAPKRETGIIFTDGETIDDATRLVNVAITRTRGKFIVISDYSYLMLHRDSISPEMLKLLNLAKSCNHFEKDYLIDFITKNNSVNTARCFRTVKEAAEVLVSDVMCGTDDKKLTYWHSKNNRLLAHATFTFAEFTEILKKAKNIKRWSSITLCSGATPNADKLFRIVFPSFSPTNDYLIGENTFVWFGLPEVTNRYNGRMIPFVLRGRNTTYVFESLCGHDKARKEWNTYRYNKSATTSDFSDYISRQFSCSECRAGSTVKKTSGGKYIIACPKCGKCLSPYVPYQLVEEYLLNNGIACNECGAKLRVNRFGKLQCSADWDHNCGTRLEDIYSKAKSKK